MENEPFIVKWYEMEEETRLGWFLRRINSSGNFYGEVTNFSTQVQRTITGSIPEPDLQSLHGIIHDIRQQATKQDPLVVKSGWVGLLAVGTTAKPTILLRCYNGDEEFSEAARLFLKLISLLRPYVKPAN